MKNNTPVITMHSADELRAAVRLSHILPWQTPVASVISIERPGYEKAAARHKNEQALLKRGYAPRLNPDKTRQLILTFGDGFDRSEQNIFSPASMQEIDSFVATHRKETPGKAIIVSSAMNISRGAVGCIATQVAHEFQQAGKLLSTPALIMKKLLKQCPKAAPDETAVHVIETYFGLGNALSAAIAKHPGIQSNREKHYKNRAIRL